MNIGDRVKVIRNEVRLPGLSLATQEMLGRLSDGAFLGCTGEVVNADPWPLVGNSYIWVEVKLVDVPLVPDTVTTWFHDSELTVVESLEQVVFAHP